MVQNNSQPIQPDLVLTPEDSKGTIEEHSGGDDGNDPIPNQEARPTSSGPEGAGLLTLLQTVWQTLKGGLSMTPYPRVQ